MLILDAGLHLFKIGHEPILFSMLILGQANTALFYFLKNQAPILFAIISPFNIILMYIPPLKNPNTKLNTHKNNEENTIKLWERRIYFKNVQRILQTFLGVSTYPKEI